MANNYVRIGQKVRFNPFGITTGLGFDELRYEFEGTVVEIYQEHQWFSVLYGEPKQRISFKFCDIGERVILLG